MWCNGYRDAPDDFAGDLAYAPGMGGMALARGSARDDLTGLADAAAARDWIDAAAADGARAMLISLSRLQTINLAYGKAAGDQVLVDVAARIRDFAASTMPEQPLLARLTGGQFLFALAGAGERVQWQDRAEALARVVGRALPVDSDALHLMPRIALIEVAPGDSGEAVIDRLARASDTLKRMPGWRVLWADQTEPVPGAGAALLEGDLLGAMHRNEIVVLFQPQFDCASGALAGAEALARWDHPRFGRIAAETLFAVAERGDLVAQLSQHIAVHALALAAGWPAPLRLSLNITAEDFAAGDVAQRLRRALADSGFAPDRLTLEITEQSLIGDFEACAAALQELAGDGVRVALDDFGTGFSNFRNVKALPLDALKLDGSLVRDIAADPRDRAIVAAIIAMAHALDLKVVAEGVETPEQLQALADQGCHLFQGFLRSGPLSPEAFAELAAK